MRSASLSSTFRNVAVLTQVPVVAVVGNPNAGKTTVFNGLTGLRQKVGNYPGVTVERASGRIRIGEREVEILDIPGLYSVAPTSEDERVAVEAMTVERPDLIVYVLDADNLERNLFLFSQVAELGIPTLVALTMVDRVESKGGSVDFARLANLLGVEVVPLVAHRERGISELRNAIDRSLENPRPAPAVRLPDPSENAIAELRERLGRAGSDFRQAEVREALEDPEHPIHQLAEEFPEVHAAFVVAQDALVEASAPMDNAARYRWSGMVRRAAIIESEGQQRKSLTDRLDRVLTHRLFGLLIFVGMMYLVFQGIYTFSAPLMTLIEGAFAAFGDKVGGLLLGNEVLRSAVVDGLIAGVGGAVVFLPQILILFFFIALLEGTGYLARAAFLMDRLLGWCGLNGRAFIPLLSSFACAIPGVMAARVMPDAKSRLATILVAPLMSCSARLPVYLVLIGAFVQPKYGAFWAGFALFAMHLLGLMVAIPIVWVLNRSLLKGSRLPFVLELPPYQWPRWKDVWLAMFYRGMVFLKTAGTIIVVMSLLIWGLSYFPRSAEADASYRAEYLQTAPAGLDQEELDHRAELHVDQERLAASYLGRFGKAIEPAFVPAGFDWRITTAILSAFPAREVVVPALGIIFNLGGEVDEKSPDLRKTLESATWPDGRPLFTLWTAIGLMVFFALCCQCMATLAVVKRETNTWKWPAFMFTYMTTLAYVAAVLIHQIGVRFS